MKPPTLQVTKDIVLEPREIVTLLVDVLYEKARHSTGKDRTLYFALSSLAGRSDVEAIKVANRKADRRGYPRVKVTEFRRWLLEILSEVFAGFLGMSSDETCTTLSTGR